MPRVFIKTYGCQMNERDSEQVARQLQQRGYELAPTEQDADVILLNTCSVRDLAEQKAINKMQNLQALKKRKGRVILGFLGCMAQSRGRELLDRLPDLDLVIGTQQFHRVADYIDQLLKDSSEPVIDTREEAGSQNTIRDHVLEERQVSAFVSVMQGCNMHCTFCIVPSTRGEERSRPLNEIEEEVKMLVANGVREVTLLGQIVNLYGRHEFPDAEGRSPFVQLLHRLHKIEGLQRIRFTSPHPIGMKADVIQAYEELPKLCSHLHLPVQSGSDRILKVMHRAYTVEKYHEIMRGLRKARPDILFSTDIIVGFPGETDEDFQQTKRLVEEIEFDQAFIFKYSERRDTPAAAMPDQVPQEVKEERNQTLLKLIDIFSIRNNEALHGKNVEVLVEGPSKTNPQRLTGRTSTNKIVVFEGDPRHVSQLLNVRIERSSNFTLYADPVIHGDD